MQVNEIEWTQTEKEIAEKAFRIAYEREIGALIDLVRDSAESIHGINDVWQLHDFLSGRRHEIDGKYDYSYSALIFVFAQLIKQGWLSLDELDGLGRDKLSKIAAMTRM